MKIRIYYHDTDCGGVVYYANYLKFLEQARTEFFEKKGVPIGTLAKEGMLFVVARQEIDYKSPSFYGDTLDVDARLESIGAAKLEFTNRIMNQDEKMIAQARTIVVCIGRDFKPKHIPQDIRNKLK